MTSRKALGVGLIYRGRIVRFHIRWWEGVRDAKGLLDRVREELAPLYQNSGVG
jgi:hypothetical protein